MGQHLVHICSSPGCATRPQCILLEHIDRCTFTGGGRGGGGGGQEPRDGREHPLVSFELKQRLIEVLCWLDVGQLPTSGGGGGGGGARGGVADGHLIKPVDFFADQ